MIALGQIRLQHRTSVYDARNKVRGLANALGYDPIEATRLATAVSEAARVLLRNDLESRISVALAMEFSPPQLVLDFECRGDTPELTGLAGFFDALSRTSDRDGFQVLRALKWLPNPAFEATDAFVAEQARTHPEALPRGADGRDPAEESRPRAAQRGAGRDRGPAHRWS